ncbi:MAG: hypothetical protein GXP16_16240 [Gammaproteobacteria bacterium]|nr:hypothetical protein [Gammaproteobacteria bacterium]
MPTVMIGSARDIVEYCAVPRFLYVDFPLGNPCGKPWDTSMQKRIVEQALSLFESVHKPMTTVVSAEVWGEHTWRQHFLEVTADNRIELAQKGEALRLSRSQRQRRAD